MDDRAVAREIGRDFDTATRAREDLTARLTGEAARFGGGEEGAGDEELWGCCLALVGDM